MHNGSSTAGPINPSRRRFRRGRILVATLVFAGLLDSVAFGSTAHAASLWSSVPEPFPCDQPNNSCVAHTGFDPLVSHWGQTTNPKGNCTNYVAFRLERNGAPRLNGRGDAVTWRDRVIEQFGAAAVNNTPTVGSVAWWNGRIADGSGHVAYVEKVVGSTIYVSDSSFNIGSDRRVLTPDMSFYPDAFLHIMDAPDDGGGHPPAPVNQPPTAEAGGPYAVDEGGSVQLNGSGSDPEGGALSYSWVPGSRLSNASSAKPTFSAGDNGTYDYELTVTDDKGASDSDTARVTVRNVAPSVSASATNAREGASVSLHATYSDPGPDTHTARIDWGDGQPPTEATASGGTVNATHVYGDNGTYEIVVTVRDDDGGTGSDTTTATISNADPRVDLDTGPATSFPGGDHVVAKVGESHGLDATALDPGSDDLTFDWSWGPQRTVFNNGESPDPPMSPAGTFPFSATDSPDYVPSSPGIQSASLHVADDDGGDVDATADLLVLGDEVGVGERQHWLAEFVQERTARMFPFARGSIRTNPNLTAYLDITRAVSSIFDEERGMSSNADAISLLSSSDPSADVQADAELLVAWLNVASGRLDLDREFTIGGRTATALQFLTSLERNLRGPTADLPAALAIQVLRELNGADGGQPMDPIEEPPADPDPENPDGPVDEDPPSDPPDDNDGTEGSSSECADATPTIEGTDGVDFLVGTAGPDVIFGYGGNDTLIGLGGDDLLCGGDGKDILYGDERSGDRSTGHDVLDGGGDDDVLYGDLGDDVLRGGDGRDVLNGGDGDDRLDGGSGRDVLNGGSGSDLCTVGDPPDTRSHCES